MSSPMQIAIQYLENGPHLAQIAPAQARAHLRAAFDRLPIGRVLLGWSLPELLMEAIAEECVRTDARLYLWHPLLTGDSQFIPRPKWQTIGVGGEPVSGFRGMAEFTFVCPNKPAVQEAVLNHLAEVTTRGYFRGVFLDRIRFPSPAANPARDLACFCEDCQRAAGQAGLDLDWTQQQLRNILSTPEGRLAIARHLLSSTEPSSLSLSILGPLLSFRQQCISRLIQTCADRIHGRGLEVGLDCFTPTLTHMVGQDLQALSACCDWIKVMTYVRAYGPASIPFELSGLARWLISNGAGEPDALSCLSEATGWPLPDNLEDIRRGALSADILTQEIQRGRVAQPRPLLAGIELVEIPGVAELTTEQIKVDIAALCAGGVDGLVLSWDLWHMPLERLELVNA